MPRSRAPSAIGVEFDMDKDKHLVIESVLPGTPASGAGLQSGDILTQIGSQSTAQMSLDDAAKLLRGDVGTTVTIKIWRQQDSQYHTVTLKREQISIPSATGADAAGLDRLHPVTTFNQASTLPQLSRHLPAWIRRATAP